MRRLLLGFVGGVMLTAYVSAKPNSTIVTEGKDYTLLDIPVEKTAETKGRINVKEFFSFTCIHCKDIEPLIEKYITSNKAVDLEKIQVVWNNDKTIADFARLNATFEILGLRNLYGPAFNAIFAKRNIIKDDELKKFLAENKLKQTDIDKFMATYNSFTVNSKAAEYKVLTEKYKVTGTPTLIIADKYVPTPALPEQLVKVTQALIDKAIAEQNKSATKKEAKRKD